MKLTASPTVLRFLTSSSGIRTPNFSSALTTMVIIEMESMSRSSVKDLSISTASVARPVSSLTISARPARISSLLAIDGSFSGCCPRLPVECRQPKGGNDSNRGFGLVRECLRAQHAGRALKLKDMRCKGETGGTYLVRKSGGCLRKHDHLGAEDQTGSEADLQRQPAAELGVFLKQAVGGQGEGRRRRISGVGDVAGDLDGFGQLQLLGHLVDDAHVGLVRDERGQILGPDAGGIQGLLGHLGHLPHGPAEHSLAVLTQGRPEGCVGHCRFLIADGGAALAGQGELADVQHGVGHADGIPLAAVRTPHRGADAGGVGGADHDSAGAVAKQEGDGPFRVVDDVGELLGTDHQDVGGRAGAHQGVALGDAVAVAGACRGDVEGRGRRRAQAVGEARCCGRGRIRMGDRGNDHGAELGGLDAGLLQGFTCGALGHVNHADIGGRAVPGDDARALADPLIRGVDPLAHVLVGHDHAGPVGADTHDAGVCLHRCLLQSGNAHAPPSSSANRARAAERSSGVLTVTVLTPGMPRLARPASVPAGASSITPVTPRCTIVSMHWSQRTGRETWAIRLSTAAAPSVTSAPSKLDSNGTCGSFGCSDGRRACRAAPAGAMCEVWNAPATFSGMTLALAGGFSARAFSCSRVPAATVWPAPLTLAAVAPAAPMAARTSAGSPPTTALMPVGVAAAAAAILLARSRTNVMASDSDRTPAREAAVISPTEWPARMTGSVPSSTSNSDFAVTRPAATIRGCATAVSLMVSSSEVVPWAVRSMPAISLREARRPATGGSSSQGARKPGVWEPCPGQTIASTEPAFQITA